MAILASDLWFFLRRQEQFQRNPDSYNGAVRENYTWSQDYTDLELKVPVPKHVVKGRQVSGSPSRSARAQVSPAPTPPLSHASQVWDPSPQPPCAGWMHLSFSLPCHDGIEAPQKTRWARPLPSARAWPGLSSALGRDRWPRAAGDRQAAFCSGPVPATLAVGRGRAQRCSGWRCGRACVGGTGTYAVEAFL